jgi:hypothetical protein
MNSEAHSELEPADTVSAPQLHSNISSSGVNEADHWMHIRDVLIDGIECITDDNVDSLLSFQNVFNDIFKLDIDLQTKLDTINHILYKEIITQEDINTVLSNYILYNCDGYLFDQYRLDIYHIRAWLRLNLPFNKYTRLKMYSYINTELCRTGCKIIHTKKTIKLVSDQITNLPNDIPSLMGNDKEFVTLMGKFQAFVTKTFDDCSDIFTQVNGLQDVLKKITFVKRELDEIASFRSSFYIFPQRIKTNIEDNLHTYMGGIESLTRFEELVNDRILVKKFIVYILKRKKLKKKLVELESHINVIKMLLRV